MTVKEKNLFLSMLDQRAQELTMDINALTMSGRTDEANLKKAARNIYTSMGEAVRKDPGDSAFLEQLETLRMTWQASRDTASSHRDWDRAAAEDAKMAALHEIQALYDGAKREVD